MLPGHPDGQSNKTLCCQCDYHSYVNELGETKKEINM